MEKQIESLYENIPYLAFTAKKKMKSQVKMEISKCRDSQISTERVHRNKESI